MSANNELIAEVARIQAMARVTREALYDHYDDKRVAEVVRAAYHVLDVIVDRCERLLDVDCAPADKPAAAAAEE